jgi:hypothetical protein
MEDREVLSTASGQWLCFLTFSSTVTFQVQPCKETILMINKKNYLNTCAEIEIEVVTPHFPLGKKIKGSRNEAKTTEAITQKP